MQTSRWTVVEVNIDTGRSGNRKFNKVKNKKEKNTGEMVIRQKTVRTLMIAGVMKALRFYGFSN